MISGVEGSNVFDPAPPELLTFRSAPLPTMETTNYFDYKQHQLQGMSLTDQLDHRSSSWTALLPYCPRRTKKKLRNTLSHHHRQSPLSFLIPEHTRCCATRFPLSTSSLQNVVSVLLDYPHEAKRSGPKTSPAVSNDQLFQKDPAVVRLVLWSIFSTVVAVSTARLARLVGLLRPSAEPRVGWGQIYTTNQNPPPQLKVLDDAGFASPRHHPHHHHCLFRHCCYNHHHYHHNTESAS